MGCGREETAGDEGAGGSAGGGKGLSEPVQGAQDGVIRRRVSDLGGKRVSLNGLDIATKLDTRGVGKRSHPPAKVQT